MKNSQYPVKISYESLKAKTETYESTITNALRTLEDICRIEVPRTLAHRKEDDDALLEKSEVTKLMDWKLKHGKYRPNLPKLLASNSEDDIRSTTKDAFTTYIRDPSDPIKPLNTLAKLKGIGPATASLILSCFDQQRIPFFSDELFRYIHFEEGTGKGWDRKISYSMKEYKSLLEKVTQLKERLKGESGNDVSALDVEKAAYVLYREKEEKPDRSGEGRKIEDDDHQPPAKRRKVSVVKDDEKRKASPNAAATDNTREGRTSRSKRNLKDRG